MVKPIYDSNGRFVLPTLVLCNRNKHRIGVIYPYDEWNITVDLNMNYEASFKVYKYVDGELNTLWDKIIDLKLIYIPEYDEYFEIAIQVDETNNDVKSVTMRNLVQSELSQTILYDIELNTELDISRDDYVMAKIWDDEKPETSILGRVLSKAPHYSVKHVDDSLKDLVRVFSVDNSSIYDFLSGTLAEEIHALVIPHSNTRQISLYDLYDVCNNPECKHRADNMTVCEKCGGTDITKGYGEPTNIYMDVSNLAENISVSTNKDEIKNTFRVKGGDDVVTAAVTALNPNGTQYITRFNEDMYDDMSEELSSKLKAYEELRVSKMPEYEEKMKGLFNAINLVQYWTSTAMPEVDPGGHTCQEEVDKLTVATLGNIAVQNYSTATQHIVENTVTEYAKVFLDSGFIVEIEDSEFNKDARTWTGRFVVKIAGYDYLSVAEEERQKHMAKGNLVTLNITDDYKTFVKQKLDKTLSDYEIRQQLQYDWSQYCLNRLQSFLDGFGKCIEILTVMNIHQPDNTLHSIYERYEALLNEVLVEYQIRKEQIDNLITIRDAYIIEKNQIQAQLNLRNYLGEELYLDYCAYRREDTYENANYISDGLVTGEYFEVYQELDAKTFELAEQLLDAANKELYRASEIQYTISATVGNLYAMPEFKDWLSDPAKSFKPGNWIIMKADGKLFRLRLLQYTINDSDLSHLPMTFSNVTKVYNGYSDIQSVLQQAQSMSTSFNAITNQVDKNTEVGSSVGNWVENGLNATRVKIMDSNNQNIVIDEHGILGRNYETTTESYDDEQFKFINNILAFTDDNWQTIKTAIGKITYQNPVDQKYYEDYGLIGDVIVGKMLFGKKLTVADEKNTIVIDGDGIKLSGGDITWTTPINGDNIEGLGDITEFKENVASTLGVTTITADSVISPKIGGGYLYINKTDGCSVEIDPLGLDDKSVFRIADKDNKDLLKVDNLGNASFSGNITSTSGSIGNITIDSEGLYSKDDNNITSGISKAGTDRPVFWAGATLDKAGSAPFRVLDDGTCVANALFANNSVLEGCILHADKAGLVWIDANNFMSPILNVKAESQLIASINIGNDNNQIIVDGRDIIFNSHDDAGIISFVSANDLLYNGYNLLFSANNTVRSLSNIADASASVGAYLQVLCQDAVYGITYAISDTKLKKNIQPTNTTALDKINEIEFIQFDWKNNDQHEQLGVSANQLETVVPELVYDVNQGDANDYGTLKNIDNYKLNIYSLKAIQELSEKVKYLEEKLKAINNNN